jgi:alpha-tubulin suppressor-like RCC1 family protein
MRKKVFSILLILAMLAAGNAPAAAREDSAVSDNGTVRSFAASGSGDIFADAKVRPQVAGGFGFSVLLRDDGTVWACGVNNLAQCGNSGHYYDNGFSKLRQVNGLTDVIAIDCADSYTLALKSDGTVWGWGWNTFNGLGEGKPETCVYASRLAGISGVKAIAAGNHMSIFVKEDGTVWYTCQQDGKAGKMKTLKDLEDIVSVKSAHQGAIALTKGGEVWTWEWDHKDGYGYTVSTPVKQKLKDIKSVESGEFHYMALAKDGSLWLWGMNNSGEIGDGTHEWCYSPKKILSNVKMMTAGGYYSMAELKDGTVYAWGDNECGQFGNNSLKSTTKPVKVSGLKDVIAMDAGMYHTLAIRGNGEVVIMGNNYDGLLGLGDKKEHITPTKLTDLSKKVKPMDNPDEIYPNGDLSDWGKADPIAKGTAPKNEKLVGIKALYARMEEGNLYLAAAITNGIPAYVDFSLDFNGDGEKDYQVNFTDEKHAHVYQFKKNGKTMKRMEDGYGAYGSVIEITVFLSDLDNPEQISVNAVYGADKKKNGVNTEITKWTAVPGSRTPLKDESSPKKVTFGPVTLDGRLDEWADLNKTVIEDPAGDSAAGKADVTTIYAARDSQYLYIAARVTGSFPSINTKLDCDGDGEEDYGANASSKSGEAYFFRLSKESGVTEIGRSADVAYSGDILEFVVPLSVIGNPQNDITINVWADLPGDGPGMGDDVEGYHAVAELEK